MSVFGDLVESMDGVITSGRMSMEITYAPAVGAPVPVRCIFDRNYVLAKGNANAGVEAVGPAVFVRRTALPIDPENDDPTLTITTEDFGTEVYEVIERRTDGMGGIVLVLRLKT